VLDGLDDETLERSLQGGSMRVRIGPDDLLRALVVPLRFGVGPSSRWRKLLRASPVPSSWSRSRSRSPTVR